MSLIQSLQKMSYTRNVELVGEAFTRKSEEGLKQILAVLLCEMRALW